MKLDWISNGPYIKAPKSIVKNDTRFLNVTLGDNSQGVVGVEGGMGP